MRKQIQSCIFAFALVLFASIESFAQTNEQYKTQIEKLNKEMAEAMVSGNSEKSMSYYASDVISLPNYEKMLEGKDALRKSNEAMAKAGWKIKSFKAVTLKVMSCDNMITEIGTFKIGFAMEGMEQPVEDVGKYITIWEKQTDGALKIKIETWNSDTNPMDSKE